jgi:hypothetical protein
MSKQQKKMAKKKTRERTIQDKLRVKRENKRKQEKNEREEFLEKEAHNKMIKERVKLEQFIEAADGKLPEDLEERMRHNISILKALEEEHAAELQARKDARDRAEALIKEGKSPIEHSPEMQRGMAAFYGLDPQAELEVPKLGVRYDDMHDEAETFSEGIPVGEVVPDWLPEVSVPIESIEIAKSREAYLADVEKWTQLDCAEIEKI